MKTVFADTFYFLALLNPADEAHARAVTFTAGNDFRVVTTGWILTEIADGLATTGLGRAAFLGMLADLRADADATIIDCDAAVMEEGVRLYGQRLDKQWSLTDCISFVVMARQRVTEALTADHHFEQAGFTALLKG